MTGKRAFPTRPSGVRAKISPSSPTSHRDVLTAERHQVRQPGAREGVLHVPGRVHGRVAQGAAVPEFHGGQQGRLLRGQAGRQPAPEPRAEAGFLCAVLHDCARQEGLHALRAQPERVIEAARDARAGGRVRVPRTVSSPGGACGFGERAIRAGGSRRLRN